MHINIEFLDDDPIENVITCMNFKIDKTIFFGDEEVIQRQRDKTRKFLKKYCAVKSVEFIVVPPTNLNKCIQIIRTNVMKEVEAGNQVYFDVVGGESLVMVAFGMLANELNAPIHMYDVDEDRLIEYEAYSGAPLSASVERRKVKMDVKTFIEMQGGSVNMQLHKSLKNENDEEFQQRVKAIWEMVKKYKKLWNPFSHFLRSSMQCEHGLQVCERINSLSSSLRANNNAMKTVAKLEEMLRALERAQVIENLSFADGYCRFAYVSEQMKEMVWDGGAIFELHTYFEEKKDADDCMIGVHIDWDGMIYNDSELDVLNEIDILKINGNIPTFISCKSGKMATKETLHALYELETVAERFGGKYAKKVLVTANALSQANLERAEDMEIEVRKI